MKVFPEDVGMLVSVGKLTGTVSLSGEPDRKKF
jgi:hypothetical protein